jgi:hypothetical protein
MRPALLDVLAAALPEITKADRYGQATTQRRRNLFDQDGVTLVAANSDRRFSGAVRNAAFVGGANPGMMLNPDAQLALRDFGSVGSTSVRITLWLIRRTANARGMVLAKRMPPSSARQRGAERPDHWRCSHFPRDASTLMMRARIAA